MPSSFEEFSQHLSSQDPDSMEWADGLGCEIACELLEQLSGADWADLSSSWRLQSKRWRTCLAQTLYPKHVAASAILLDMTADQDVDVSFEALRAVSFYCGINSCSEGPFLDERIRHPVFLALAAEHPGLLLKLKEVSARCSDHFRKQFELLASQLIR